MPPKISVNGKLLVKKQKPLETPMGITDTSEGDRREISAPKTRLTSLKALLAFMEVDLKEWEVDRHVLNKWEVVTKEPATTVGGAGNDATIFEDEKGKKSVMWTRGSNKVLHEPLFQIKVWLKKRSPQALALQSLIDVISEQAPLF